MKLKPADIDRILEENIPKPKGMRSVQDYEEENAQARDALVQGLIAQNSQSSARHGTLLPPPPKTMKTHIDGPNDFGARPTSALGDSRALVTGEGEVLEAEAIEIPLPIALRGGDLDQINCRADLISLLTSNLPLNELGLPKIIYRPDLIDWKLFQGSSPLGSDPTERYKSMQQYLDVATLYLSYTEGFPALPTGEPLWARLPFEPEDHYSAFTSYCTLPGQRQVAAIQGHTLDALLQWYHEGYWSIRVKCYDMLNTIHAAKVREQRLLACEDKHYLRAEKMFQKLEDQFAEINWDVLKQDPVQYINAMEKVVKLQRIALGQGSQATEKKELKSETLEVTMRRIATPNLIEDTKGDGGVDVRQLLRNPEALASAQELIIRMSKTSSTSPINAEED